MLLPSFCVGGMQFPFLDVCVRGAGRLGFAYTAA